MLHHKHGIAPGIDAPNGKAGGIASTIRSGITQASSDTLNFIAKLSDFEAAMLALIVGEIVGTAFAWRFL